jgi:hypothetical protein
MSAIPLAAIPRVSASTVLASLRAQREGLALALAKDAPAPRQPSLAPGEGLFDSLLLEGSVVELTALPGSGALTLAFLLLAEASRRARVEGRPAYLCALDPSRTLHAPAVASLLHPRGTALGELIVLQPDDARLLRTAVRAQRCGAFAGVVVDASACPDVGGAAFVNGVRRLALAAEDQRGFAVVLTSHRARRGLPLAVGARALVEGVDGEIRVGFLKHKYGQMPRLVVS